MLVRAVVLSLSDFCNQDISIKFLGVVQFISSLLSHSTTCMSSRYSLYASHDRSGHTYIHYLDDMHACMIHWSYAPKLNDVALQVIDPYMPLMTSQGTDYSSVGSLEDLR